jgi:hypothetical protein
LATKNGIVVVLRAAKAIRTRVKWPAPSAEKRSWLENNASPIVNIVKAATRIDLVIAFSFRPAQSELEKFRIAAAGLGQLLWF